MCSPKKFTREKEVKILLRDSKTEEEKQITSGLEAIKEQKEPEQ